MRIISFFVAFVLLLSIISYHQIASANTYSDLPEVDVRAAAALLVDADTGEHLYEKNIDARREPASLTKIMTTMMALEMTDDWDTQKNELVTVTQDAFFDISSDSSSAGLKVGEELSLENLLYCIMLPSANEACNALAIHLTGSVSAFVDLMNQRAQELGCTNTHFANSHGLNDTNHYTTALDMYRITEQAMKTPHFMEIAHTDSRIVPPTNKSDSRRLTTTNSLISTSRYTEYIYPPAKGIKTGHTEAAGMCLISSAEKDNLRLVSVVMGAQQEPETKRQRHFVETALLFEWGFENFSTRRLLTKAQALCEMKVFLGVGKDAVTLVPAKEIVALVPTTLDIATIEQKINLLHPEGMEAPVYKEQVLGTVTLEAEGHVYGTVDLLAAFTVEEDTAKKFMLDIGEWFSQGWVRWALVGLGALIVLYVALTVFLNYRRQRERNRKPTNYRGRKRK